MGRITTLSVTYFTGLIRAGDGIITRISPFKENPGPDPARTKCSHKAFECGTGLSELIQLACCWGNRRQAITLCVHDSLCMPFTGFCLLNNRSADFTSFDWTLYISFVIRRKKRRLFWPENSCWIAHQPLCKCEWKSVWCTVWSTALSCQLTLKFNCFLCCSFFLISSLWSMLQTNLDTASQLCAWIRIWFN